jgi:hypothetical protein
MQGPKRKHTAQTFSFRWLAFGWLSKSQLENRTPFKNVGLELPWRLLLCCFVNPKHLESIQSQRKVAHRDKRCTEGSRFRRGGGAENADSRSEEQVQVFVAQILLLLSSKKIFAIATGEVRVGWHLYFYILFYFYLNSTAGIHTVPSIGTQYKWK